MEGNMELIGSKNVHSVHYVNDQQDEEEEHNVDQNEEKSDNGDELDFMDKSGKLWNFVCRIQDEQHLKQWCHQMDELRKENEEQLTGHYACPIENCEFEAILLKSQSKMYSRNEHNHDGMERGEDGAERKAEHHELDYVDRFGNSWPFHAKIGKNHSPDIFRREFGFGRVQRNRPTIYLSCRKKGPNGKCPIAGIYLRTNGCLYIRGKHEHSEKGKMPQNIVDDYMDHMGKLWHFNAQIDQNNHREILQNQFGFTSIHDGKNTLNLNCIKKGPNWKCKFAGIYFKANGLLYTRDEHKHEQIENDEMESKNMAKKSVKAAKNNKRDYLDRLGKLWPFHSKITNISNNKLRANFGFNYIQKHGSTLYLSCQKEDANGGKCPIAGIYFKATGCLHIRGEHEHSQKKPPPNVGADYVDIYGRNWPFYEEIGKNIPNEIFRTKFGFVTIITNKETLNLHCTKLAPNGRCQYAGIYLKENGCLYTRGEHKHSGNGKTPIMIGDNFIDIYGKSWEFKKVIGKNNDNATQKIFHNEFGFQNIRSTQTSVNLYCHRKGPNGTCKFAGVYLKANRCLYIRGQHKCAKKSCFENGNENENGQNDEGQNGNMSEGECENETFHDENGKGEEGNHIDHMNDGQQGREGEEEDLDQQKKKNMEMAGHEVQINPEGPNGQDLDQLLEAIGGGQMMNPNDQQQQNILQDQQEEHLEIVAEVNRGKWLPQMKREGEQRPQEWPVLEVDDPGADERLRRFVQRPCLTNVKKEEPVEEDDQLAAANGASQSLVNQCKSHQQMVNRDEVPASTPTHKSRYALRPRNGLKHGLLAANVHYDWLPPIPTNDDEMNATNKKKKSKIQKKN